MHWISEFLANLPMDDHCMDRGCFCFLVERSTGHIISTSDPSIPVLTNTDTTNGEPIEPIKADESSDERVATIANEILNHHDGSWDNVHDWLSREEIEVSSKGLFDLAIDNFVDATVGQPFILTSDFVRRSDTPMNSSAKDVPHGIDWIIVLTIPEEDVMSAITDRETSNSWMIIGYSVGLYVAESFVDLMFGLLVGLLVVWCLMKNRNEQTALPAENPSMDKNKNEQEDDMYVC